MNNNSTNQHSATDSGDRPKARSLRILDQKLPLRGQTALLEDLPWQDGDPQQAPRALRGLARIVDGGLCHRCGTCVGICPTGVLTTDEQEYPSIKNLNACTDCDLCVKVCPGDEFNFTEEHQALYGTPGNIEDTHGCFKDAVVGYATDPEVREGSTSGGMITAILDDLFARELIDGAIVIGSNKQTLWKGQSLLARSREQFLGAMKSKYAISPTNIGLAEIRQNPGRYVVVGLPCQMHGVRKAIALDKTFAERIVLTIGLFCHAAIEHEAFKVIWETLGENAVDAKRFISRIGKHPGTPYIERANGEMYPVYFGSRKGYRPSSIEVINVLYRLYTPQRCTTCFDGLADFADVSVGDPWMPPPDGVNWYDGWSFGVIRSDRGREAVKSAIESGKLSVVNLTEKEARASNTLMAGEKRWRAFRVIETHRRQGKPIPSYGGIDRFPRHKGWQFIATEIHMLTHIFCFLPRYRARVLKFFLEEGYWLFWLNSLRRSLRVYLRDGIAKIKRRIFGRQ